MKKITCSVCGKEINSLNQLITCSMGLFKVGAFHDYCYEKNRNRNRLVIFKPNGTRTLHLACVLFTIFVATIMIVFRAISFVTVFSLCGVIVLDIYVYLSFTRIERFIGKD